MNKFILIPAVVLLAACLPVKDNRDAEDVSSSGTTPLTHISLVVLGNVQDGGSPHIGCRKSCCRDLFADPDPDRKVVSIGIIDPFNNRKYLFEATPDLPEQMKMLKGYLPSNEVETPDGIFITHAHIGHYAGLMYLGKEAMNAGQVPVYAMPGMKNYLETNGPWSQLVELENINIREISNGRTETLGSGLKVSPFPVPHRDEYSETVGFLVEGPSRKALFIPDIDKWEKWDRQIIEELSKVDYAFIDGTFFDGEELGHRDISEIPHPFIVESMEVFDKLPAAEKNKIYFIHFNHTNPVLDPDSPQSAEVAEKGFHIARAGDVFKL